jgi:hypothetical protein
MIGSKINAINIHFGLAGILRMLLPMRRIPGFPSEIAMSVTAEIDGPN